jgi:hypothetical protein
MVATSLVKAERASERDHAPAGQGAIGAWRRAQQFAPTSSRTIVMIGTRIVVTAAILAGLAGPLAADGPGDWIERAVAAGYRASVHYRTSGEVGSAMGRQIGTYVVEHALTAR